MNRRRILLWSAGGMAVLVALALGWLLTADLGVFKPRVERFVSEQVERDFSIDGDLDVYLGRQIVVVANDIQLANAAWTDEPYMVEVGSLELRVDARSLFSGPLTVELLRIADATIRLTESAEQGRNWDLFGDRAAAEPDDGDTGGGAGWLVRQIDIGNLRLVYTEPHRPEPIDLRIERLAQRHGSDDYLDLELTATLAARELSGRARIGTWRALLAQKDLDFELSAEVDTLSLSAGGHVDDLAAPRRPDLQFEATGPDLNDLARLLGVEPEFAGDINLSGSLVPTDGGPLVLDLGGNLGQMQATAKGAFSNLQNLEQASLEASVSGPDFNRLLRLAGAPAIRPAPYALELSVERNGADLVVNNGHMSFADADFELSAHLPKFPVLDDADVRLIVRGDDFERFREITRLPGAATGPYSLEFSLSDAADGAGAIRLDARSSLVSLDADGTLGDAPDYNGSRFNVRLDTDSLAAVGEAWGWSPLPDRPVSVAGAMQLTDAGIRTNGPVTVTSNDVVASVDGLVALQAGMSGSDLSLSVSGPALNSALAEIATSDAVPALPFTVDGQLQFRGADLLLPQLRATLGRARMSVGGTIKTVDGLSGTTLQFSAETPALDELVSGIDGLTINPGPTSLSGRVTYAADTVRLEDIDLSRPRGRLTGNVALALPVSDRAATFDLRARGDDLRTVTGKMAGFEPSASPFAIDVRGNSRDRLVTFDKLDVEFGRARLMANGRVDTGNPTGNTRLNLNLRVPDLAELGLWNGRRFNPQAFAFDAQATTQENVLIVDNLAARIGDSDVRGAVRIEGGEVPELTVAISSDALRYAPLLEVTEPELVSEPERQDGRLIPDVGIPFEQMKRLNATVDVNITEFQRGNLRLSGVEARTELRGGSLTVRGFGFRGPRGWLQAQGSLEPADGRGKASFALSTRDLAIAFGKFNENLSASGRLEVNLQATGNDLRSLAGSATGVVFGRLNDVTVADNAFFRRLYGDMLTEIVDVINPFAKTETQRELECVILPLELADGNLRSRPSLLIRTQKLRIVSEATINLRNERIDLQFNTTPRRGITISAGELLNPYVKVTGTLARPRLAVDQQGMLLSGGAAVATGGISVLAQAAWQRLSRDADPCATVENLGIEALGNRFANLEPGKPN